MAAGESAGEEARRARAVSQRHQRKADRAAFAADNWERGAAGEAAVGAALDSLGSAWRVLHDRRAPGGGNVDHVAIGPPGVAVVDAKNWSSAVSVSGQRLLTASGDRTDALDHLNDLVDHVRAILRTQGSKVAVRGYLVLTGDADRARPSEDVGDLRVLGVEALTRRLAKGKADLDPDEVADVAEAIDVELPPMSGAPITPAVTRKTAEGIELPAEPRPLFDRVHRFYYLQPWRRGAHDRMYLKDRFGTGLGWVDLKTGAVRVECGGLDAQFAEILLNAADKGGVKVAPGDLPKEPMKLFGGRLLSRIARWHTAILLGQEWRNYGRHRLYGQLIDPHAATAWDLGYVDLKADEMHPVNPGVPLAKDRSGAERYLGYLWTRWPGHTARSAT